MFEDVPGSCCGTSSSSSESMGICFFASGTSRGFFTSAVFFFPFCLWDFLFFVATFNGHSCDFCGSTPADSSSVYIGICTGARCRNLDLCRLPELPASASGTVNGLG